MSATHVAEAVLLTLGVGSELLCCLGVAIMQNVFDRLHYVSGASTVGPILIVVAVIVDHRLDATGLKALLVLGFVLVSGPVITHAVARAARLKDFGAIA